MSLVYTKNNLIATVVEVLEGYIYRLKTKGGEIIKTELTKVYTPLDNEPGAFQCREFARKNLIGKEVNVFFNKDDTLSKTASIVRLSDNKDVETLMIENGFGFLKDGIKESMFYAKLSSIEKKAKELMKGIHNSKIIGVQFYEDFSIPNSKKKNIERKNTIDSKMSFAKEFRG